MPRRIEVDALRGLMLVWMTCTHLPTIISTYGYQPIGFVSSAEGFIFLSALFTGLVYYKAAMREGFEDMRSRLWNRTFKIYSYHVLMVGLAFIFLPLVAKGMNRPGLHNLLDFYFSAGPVRAGVDAAALIYRPPLLDILPMYVIFLALTPLVLTLATRIGWRYFLGGSVALWALAQIGLRQATYNLAEHLFKLKIPLNEMGAFDLWAWQLIWMFGLWCGVRWEQDDLPAGKWAKKIWIPAAVVVTTLILLRYALNYGVDLGRFEPAFDKWHLGVVRLLDFTCVAALLIHFQQYLKHLAVRPLIMLGQASLPVFCTHIGFCFLGLAIMKEHPTVVGWEQVALPVLTFATMYGVAKKVAEGKKRPSIPAQPSFAAATSR
jgi:hypothetical protein